MKQYSSVYPLYVLVIRCTALLIYSILPHREHPGYHNRGQFLQLDMGSGA